MYFYRITTLLQFNQNDGFIVIHFNSVKNLQLQTEYLKSAEHNLKYVSCQLRCDTVYTGRSIPTFKTILSLQLFYHDDGGSRKL